MYRIGQEEIDAVAKVIEQRSLFKINNKLQETKHAEEEMRALFGTKYPLLMTNGYAALTCALIGMGIGPGDEVIVPAYTYISSAMAVVEAGAMPIIVDVDESLVDEKGRLCLEKAGLVAYAHGEYFSLGKRLGSFGFSVKKKKK